MRTVFIRGTDTSGVPADATEKPITDGGLKFDRSDPLSMLNEVYEMVGIAGIEGIAMGLRGERDAGFQYIPIFLTALESYAGPFVRPPPTIMPFIDTGALRDIVNYDHEGAPIKFDFRNDAHLDRFWTRFLAPFYRITVEGKTAPNPIKFERTPDGRLVILVWSIAPGLETAVNQTSAQRLLDYCSAKMVEAGLSEPAFIVDQTWMVASGLNVYGIHRWFAPWDHQAYSVNTHNGVTVGVAVPGFQSGPTSWWIKRDDGRVLRAALSSMRSARADYVFLESYNNWIERAGFYRSDAWASRNLYLDIVCEHLALTSPVIPKPKPVDPVGGLMYAVSKEPLTDMVLLPVVKGFQEGTFAIRWNKTTNQPDPKAIDAAGKPTYYSLQPDGKVEVRTEIGAWESGKPYGDKLVFTSADASTAIFGFVDLQVKTP